MRFFLLAALCCATVFGAQNGTTVEGTVVDRVTQRPVAGANIILIGVRDAAEHRAVSASDGTFRIEGVREGQYGKYCEKDGYEDVQSGPGPPRRPIVISGENTRLRFELIPDGTVRGRVLDAEGHPVKGARVDLSHLDSMAASVVETDAEGRFTIPNAGPGTYTLQTRPAADYPAPKQAEGAERTAWAMTYFPRGLRRIDAQHIVVRAGAVLDGFEFRVLAAPVHRVRGVVVDDAGKPAGGANVRLVAPDQWNGAPAAQAVAKADGTFEFPSVTERDWRLETTLTRGQVKLRDYRALLVGRRDIDDLEIRVSAPFDLEATVEWKDAPQNFKPQANLIAFSDLVMADPSNKPLDEQGRMKLEGVYPGPYRIEAYLFNTPGYYFASIQYGGRDILGRTVEIANGSVPLHVVFQPGAGAVRGTVADCAGCTVVLWALDEPFVEMQFLHMAGCDADGHFEVSELAPREYYAVAFYETGDRYQLADPDFARMMQTRSVRVRVEKGATVAVELKPIAWPE